MGKRLTLKATVVVSIIHRGNLLHDMSCVTQHIMSPKIGEKIKSGVSVNTTFNQKLSVIVTQSNE